jgi:hypothetical protein
VKLQINTNLSDRLSGTLAVPTFDPINVALQQVPITKQITSDKTFIHLICR